MNKVRVPTKGQKITMVNRKLIVPDNPIIPFIEGDGIGPDIWAAAVRVLDAAVEKAYGDKKKIQWMKYMQVKNLMGCMVPIRGFPRKL